MVFLGTGSWALDPAYSGTQRGCPAKMLQVLFNVAGLQGKRRRMPEKSPEKTAPLPYDLIDADAAGPAFILCDHASNAVPDWIGNGSLGLSAADMSRHIAYDVGAAAVARALAARLGAPAILSAYSRLVVDLNRGADDPTLVMQLYDGSIVPGNRGIAAAAVAERVARLYQPYHDAAAGQIDAMLARGVVPHLISIHSFTPSLRGKAPRPWHAGVLSAADRRLAEPVIAALAALPGMVVGDNEPYTGSLSGDCMDRHGLQRGLPHVLIEVRNDLIADAEGQALWAERLAAVLAPLLPVAGTSIAAYLGGEGG